MNRIHALVLAASLSLSLAVRADLPPAFTDITLDAAKKQVEGTEKLVVIKFTAVWCGPCKAMDKTTWRDDKVVEWVKSRGLALEVDVDKEPKIAEQYNIAAMPTMVMLKGGNEIARTVGYIDGKRMLAWLEKASSGKAEEVARVDRTSKDMQAQLQIARELVFKGNADAATDDFVWLWQNIAKIDPAIAGVRVSFLASDMKNLAARHPKAKAAFTALRDDAAKAPEGKDTDYANRVDWIVLNGVIDDSKQTLAWFDRVKGSDEGKSAFGQTAYLLEPLFLESDRLADLPLVYADPIGSMKLAASLPETYTRTVEARGEKPDEDAIASMKEQFRQKWARVYVGYLAAGKDEKAGELAAEFVKLEDPTDARFAMLNAAAEFKQVRPVHLEWVKEIEDSGANLSLLRGKIEAALNKK
ncbi:MAG: thioredoxin fold domain-containing protein [Phycisphaerales bacterium]|nr:thioredoxin fold domain-containing protein [Phycisphaerales bacterium]